MAEFQRVTISITQGRDLAAKDLFTSDPFFVAKLNGTVCHKSKVIKATLTPTWTKGESFTLARYNKKIHGVILIELWDFNLLLPPEFMGQIVIDPDEWVKTKGEAVWTKLGSRGIKDEEIKGELLIQVSFSETPQITYESPLWKKRGTFKSGKESVYAVLYNPSDLVIYRDITCSNELKRFSLKEGKSAVLEAKGNGMTITNAPPDGKITLTGRECFMAEWWRAFSKFAKTSPAQSGANNNDSGSGGGKIYGRNLKDMVSDGIFGSDGVTIPVFLANLFNIVEKQGLDVEGIFRLSGAKVGIDDGVKAIDGGKVFSESDELNIHIVSGLIKIFFRRLPEPLFTFELYSKFIDAANIADPMEGKLRIMELVKQLPPVNRAVLSSLLSLLAKVATRSDVNMMTPSNLSIVFAPAVLWPKVQNALLTLTDLNSAQSVIEILIVSTVEALAAEEEVKRRETEQQKGGNDIPPPPPPNRTNRMAKIERKVTMLSYVKNNQQKVRPAIIMDDPVKEMETNPEGFKEKARALFEGYDDDSNKFLDTDEFTLFFIDLIKEYSLSYITRDDVMDIMEKISEGDMKITFEQFFSWWTEFNRTLQKE